MLKYLHLLHAACPHKQAWKCLFDTLPKEWMESVQLVLDYFCERTPRSVVEVGVMGVGVAT